MPRPLLLVTGFGPFLQVERNPSGEVALALAAEPPEEVEVVARVLSVSFRDAPRELAQLLTELEPRRPDAILGLGVQKESWFRLERRARAVLDSEKLDREGRRARELGPLGPHELSTPLDLTRFVECLLAAGATRVGISDHAGGYVCERVYHAELAAAERLGIPALFLHVPADEHVSSAEQVPIVRALARDVAQLCAERGSRGRHR